MRILFSPCHYFFDKFKQGSEYSWAFNIADRIGRQFPKSVIVTGYKNKTFSSPYKIIEVHQTQGKIDLGSVTNALVFNLKYFFVTQKLLADGEFDIIHHVLPFGIDSTFNLSFLLNRTNSPLVIGPVQAPPTHFQSQRLSRRLIGYFLNGLLSSLSAKTLQKADCIIVVSEAVAKLVQERGVSRSKIVVIPPGIDTKRFKYVPGSKKKTNKIQLLVVCYLIKRKAVDLVIRAIGKVVATNQNIELNIVGDGPEMKRLQKLVSDLNINRYVKFEGLVPYKKIQNHYRNAHIFLNMSRSEGFATVCLEAMASGLVVISSRVGGFSEAIQNGKNGLLVDQGDVNSLASRILFLSKNPKIISKLAEQARITIEKHYDWESDIIPKYVKVYKSFLSGKTQ